ncbi:unnamed protein product [Tilletia caries]|nr:hypothetical protein CF336_g7744 [Tilletia laevis]KAE8187226.1 hypothetical protein CF335_g7233 [Tilletia laevis]CAD6951688.1 unnamed protein product [Tilletia caries]CAD7064401.1 unnamed protein product [Tilletia caries]
MNLSTLSFAIAAPVPKAEGPGAEYRRKDDHRPQRFALSVTNDEPHPHMIITGPTTSSSAARSLSPIKRHSTSWAVKTVLRAGAFLVSAGLLIKHFVHKHNDKHRKQEIDRTGQAPAQQ